MCPAAPTAGAASSRCQKRTHAGTNRSPTAANSAALHPAAMPPGTDRPGVRAPEHEQRRERGESQRIERNDGAGFRLHGGTSCVNQMMINCSTRGG